MNLREIKYKFISTKYIEEIKKKTLRIYISSFLLHDSGLFTNQYDVREKIILNVSLHEHYGSHKYLF